MFYKSLIITIFLASIASNAEAKSRKLAYYKKIDATITKAAAASDVPAELLIAICWHESGRYRQNLPETPDGNTPSYGICQVKLETASHMDDYYNHKAKITVERLRDPYINAFYAGRYLKYQLKRYNNWRKAVAAYNRGSYSAINPNVKYLIKVEGAFAEKKLDPSIIFEDSNAKIMVRNP